MQDAAERVEPACTGTQSRAMIAASSGAATGAPMIDLKSLRPTDAPAFEAALARAWPGSSRAVETRDGLLREATACYRAVLDSFSWVRVEDPGGERRPVTSWTRQPRTDGAVGAWYLGYSEGGLTDALQEYDRPSNAFARCEPLERAVLDMLVYAECGGIGIDRARRSLTWRTSLRFRLLMRLSPKARRMLAAAEDSAWTVYDSLDEAGPEPVPWLYVDRLVRHADERHGVGWRTPLRSFIASRVERERLAV